MDKLSYLWLKLGRKFTLFKPIPMRLYLEGLSMSQGMRLSTRLRSRKILSTSVLVLETGRQKSGTSSRRNWRQI